MVKVHSWEVNWNTVKLETRKCTIGIIMHYYY